MRTAAAQSQPSEKGAWPVEWRQGWKWSEMATESRPTAYACSASASSRGGANCSADAFQP